MDHLDRFSGGRAIKAPQDRLTPTPKYQHGLKELCKMERKFREAKQGYGLGRCRYLGRIQSAVQAFFTAIMLNLKHMVKLLTGVGFITQAGA
jgi:hypothetical protein